MQSVKKSIALAAVVGFLAVAPKASAGFTPPTNITPYLPANNVVTVQKVGTVGSMAIYQCSMGGKIVVSATAPVALVQVLGAQSCAWQAFRLATISANSLSDNTANIQAQQWFTANVAVPYYAPLLSAAKASAAKASAVISAPAVRRGR
jgi:hypothetical protein